jgi:Fur family ferric uptake transcriptional regulator
MANKPEMATLTGRLRRAARKITGPRAAILDLLRRDPRPLSNKEILSRLPAGFCNLATVYRSLHLLEQMKMVKRFIFDDGVARFELLREGDDGHHHHLVCTRCAEVIEIEECCTEEVEKKISRRSGFKAVTHRLEFFGICPACQ